MAYAEATTVPFEKSIAEIIGLVKRAGAEQIMQSEAPDGYIIAFRLSERLIRFRVPFVTEYTGPQKAGNGRAIDPRNVLEQSRRQRGRALMLVIKAKLESVESGIETIEEAFLAQVVMSDGQTVYERIAEPMALEYAAGRPCATQALLPPPSVP